MCIHRNNLLSLLGGPHLTLNLTGRKKASRPPLPPPVTLRGTDHLSEAGTKALGFTAQRLTQPSTSHFTYGENQGLGKNRDHNLTWSPGDLGPNSTRSRLTLCPWVGPLRGLSFAVHTGEGEVKGSWSLKVPC